MMRALSQYLANSTSSCLTPAPGSCWGVGGEHLGISKPEGESASPNNSSMGIFPPPLKDGELNLVIFQTMWEEFLPKKPVGVHSVADNADAFAFWDAVVTAFSPRVSSPLVLHGSCCSIFWNIGPCFLLLLQLTSSPLSLPFLPLTSIFFSAIASLVFRAEINCFSVLQACTLLSYVGTCNSILYPGAGEWVSVNSTSDEALLWNSLEALTSGLIKYPHES